MESYEIQIMGEAEVALRTELQAFVREHEASRSLGIAIVLGPCLCLPFSSLMAAPFGLAIIVGSWLFVRWELKNQRKRMEKQEEMIRSLQLESGV